MSTPPRPHLPTSRHAWHTGNRPGGFMRHGIRLLSASLCAATVLAAAVGTASATRVATSSQTARATWTGMEFIAEGVTTVRCPVTFEGSIHSRTILKTPGLLLGYITRGTVGEASCTNGSARLLTASLPWHSRYKTFFGTLPSITAIDTNIIGAEWLIGTRVLGVEISCLYTSTAAEPLQMHLSREASGGMTSEAISGSVRSSTGGICPRGSLGGTSSTLTVAGRSERIIVTLVA